MLKQCGLVLSLSSMLPEDDLAIDGVPVCLSVCLTHAGIDSKLMNIGSCDLHRRVGQVI